MVISENRKHSVKSLTTSQWGEAILRQITKSYTFEEINHSDWVKTLRFNAQL